MQLLKKHTNIQENEKTYIQIFRQQLKKHTNFLKNSGEIHEKICKKLKYFIT